MNINTDPTTKILLGVIATGVAALTALAFERRYQSCCSTNGPDPSSTPPVVPPQNSLKDRIEEGVDTLKEKAGAWKNKVSDSLEDAADKVKDRIKHGVEALKDGAEDAAAETKKTAGAVTDLWKSQVPS